MGGGGVEKDELNEGIRGKGRQRGSGREGTGVRGGGREGKRVTG